MFVFNVLFLQTLSRANLDEHTETQCFVGHRLVFIFINAWALFNSVVFYFTSKGKDFQSLQLHVLSLKTRTKEPFIFMSG